MGKSWKSRKMEIIIDYIISHKNLKVAHNDLLLNGIIENESFSSFKQHLNKLFKKYLNIDLTKADSLNKIIIKREKLDLSVFNMDNKKRN